MLRISATLLILTFFFQEVFSQNTDTSKTEKVYTLEEIYYRERALEGDVIIPPQIDNNYYNTIVKYQEEGKIDILILELNKSIRLAKKNPGFMKDGNMILGAPGNKYFMPSEHAKRASILGDIIESFWGSIKDSASFCNALNKLEQNKIIYNEFIYTCYTFYHVDAVGSGRFIYPDKGVEKKIFLNDILIRLAESKFPKKNFTKIKDNINVYKGKKFLDFLKELSLTIKN